MLVFDGFRKFHWNERIPLRTIVNTLFTSHTKAFLLATTQVALPRMAGELRVLRVSPESCNTTALKLLVWESSGKC